MHSLKQPPLSVNFLIYTRSVSFDYQWIYGPGDKNLAAILQKHIVQWLEPNVLAEQPPITTFFSIAGSHALMIAEQSKSRIDQEGRPIFQWSILVWTPDERLSYEHLVPLVATLEAESERVYVDVPNDTVRFETEIHNIDFNIPDLARGASKLMKDFWKLPYQLDWEHVLREKLTVEVPPCWNFSKIIAALIDRPISSVEIFYVGKSLPLAYRQPPDRAWLLTTPSPHDTNAEFEPRILDRRGRPLSEDELTRLSTRYAFPAPMKSASAPKNFGMLSSNEAQSISKVALNSQDPSTTSPVDLKVKPKPSDNDRIFAEVSKAANTPGNENSKIESVTRGLKKVWPLKRSALRKQQTQILLLLSPIIRIGSGDIKIAWSNLLDEMLLFHRKPSQGMREEWLRRLSELEAITIRNVSRYSEWSDQFSEACRSLRAIVKKL